MCVSVCVCERKRKREREREREKEREREREREKFDKSNIEFSAPSVQKSRRHFFMAENENSSWLPIFPKFYPFFSHVCFGEHFTFSCLASLPKIIVELEHQYNLFLKHLKLKITLHHFSSVRILLIVLPHIIRNKKENN